MTLVMRKIDEYAKKVGNKAANLLELQELCRSISLLPLSVSIPQLHTLDHLLITEHLDKIEPRWKELWNDFIQAQNKAEPGSLSSAAIAKLKEIRALILNAFVNHPLSTEALQRFSGELPAQSLLMVRSTGKEDTVDLANPGGNESIAAVAPDERSISRAIGEVVASYFSEKSLKQRLISNDDITEFPFMPVLVQRMIGEPLLGEKNSNAVIRSGVMYTGEAGTRIQLAPGHGELIVNSKAPFDTFFVSREQVVYAEIYRKTHRLVPVEVKKGNKTERKLELHNNPTELQNSPAVSTQVAQAIAKVGHLIEQHYGMPMDVEFVYHPEEHVLYLVQARPVPKGDLKSVVPSSIPPEKLAEVRKKGAWCSAEVITPAGSAAHIITKQDQLLICDNIGQALDYYLQQKNPPIKAVIVKEMAPETSHEAAQFNAKAIPVLAVEDLSELRQWMRQDKPVLIVDPQRKQLLSLTGAGIEHDNAKQELYAAGIIKDGFFKSPMASQVTLLPFWHKNIEAPAVNSLFPPKKKERPHVAIGELILKANSEDLKEREKALKQLLQLILNQQSALKKHPYPTLPKNNLFSFLKEQITLLESAQPGKKQDDVIWQALNATLDVFYKLASSKEGQRNSSPYRALFQQAIITGAEIFLCLQRLSQDGSNKPALQEEYLRLVSKLEGLIINPGKAQLFSDSLRQAAQDQKSFKNAEAYPGFKHLKKIQQRYFIEFFKTEKLVLNERLKKQWLDFVLACCSEPEKIAGLAYVIKFSMANEIAFDLLNNFFHQNMKKGLSHEDILNDMIKEVRSTHSTLEKLDIRNVQATLQSWDRRTGEWSDPRKFNILWNEYKREVLPLIETLSINDNMSNLSKVTIIKLVQQLTDLMDRTIKSMKGSPEYNEQLKVQYFSRLLEPFYKLMYKWVSMNKVLVHYPDHSKVSMLQAINSKFERLKKTKSSNQLNPSGRFNVSSARIGSTASFERQFNLRVLTLEDMFTLFHQNIIASTTRLNSLGYDQVLPEEIQPLFSSLMGLRNCRCIGINSHFPVVLIELTLPLRNHAANFSIEYNLSTKKTKLTVNFYGHNVENRMSIISHCALLDARIFGIHQITPALYNKNTYSLEYCWELSPAQIKELAPQIVGHIQYYVNLTFYTPPFRSVVNRLLQNIIKEELSYRGSMKLINNAQKIESTSEEIEMMKEHLKYLKMYMKRIYTNPGDAYLQQLSEIGILNKCLSADIANMNNPNEIKSLFYKVATKLAYNYYHETSYYQEHIFYAELYARTFAVHLKLGEPEHKTNKPDTENARLAQQYEHIIKPDLLIIKEKVQDLLERYEPSEPSTQCYKDAALVARELVVQIKKQLIVLEESSDKRAGVQFIKECNTLISDALKSNLIQHRGVRKGIWSTILNAMLRLVTALGIISKEHKDYLMSPSSAQKVLHLKNKFFEIERTQPISSEPQTTPKNSQ